MPPVEGKNAVVSGIIRGVKDMEKPTFETEGLITRLRPVMPQDYEWLWHLRNNGNEWSLVQNWRYVAPYDYFLQELNQEIYRGDIRVVIENKEGQPIGTLFTYDMDIYNRRCFWTTYLLPKFRKGVYTIDAVASFLDLLFGIANLHKVCASVLSYNKLSLNTMLKAGFVIEGHLRDHIWWKGQPFDEYILSMKAEEYYGKWKEYNRERIRKVLCPR